MGLDPQSRSYQSVMRVTAASLAVLALVAVPARSAGGMGRPRVGAARVTVVLPAGWHTWRPPAGLTPSVVDPLTRVVAISAPFQFAASGCQVAAYAFPSTAVALVLVEWVGATRGAHWAPRPRRFSAVTLPLRPPPAIECFDGAGGSVQFADQGRRFGAYILLGRQAPERLADQARAVLDTLQVRRRH